MRILLCLSLVSGRKGTTAGTADLTGGICEPGCLGFDGMSGQQSLDQVDQLVFRLVGGFSDHVDVREDVPSHRLLHAPRAARIN